MTTSRPTRNETLKALEWADPKTDYEYKVVQAAKAYATMAPDTCPECGGHGTVTIRVEEPSVYGTTVHEGPKTVQCPSCGGRGYVWPKPLQDWYDDHCYARDDCVVNSDNGNIGVDLSSLWAVLDVLWEIVDD